MTRTNSEKTAVENSESQYRQVTPCNAGAGSVMKGTGCGKCSDCEDEIQKISQALQRYTTIPDPLYLVSARDMLSNAKENLVYAVTAFQKTGGNFTNTISEIKEIIGDVECAIQITKNASQSIGKNNG